MAISFRSSLAGVLGFALTALTTTQSPLAHAPAESDWPHSLAAGLAPASPADVQTARRDVDAALDRLRAELSEQPIGAILGRELKLDELEDEVRKDSLDADALGFLERHLRRILPGTLQESVRQLRVRLTRLAQLSRSSPEAVEQARHSLATLQRHLHDEQRRSTSPEGEREWRQAFSTLAAVLPSPAAADSLRVRLSHPNYSSLIKRDYVESISRQSIRVPVHFRQHQQGASVRGDGEVLVALTATLPRSDRDCQLRLHAAGSGTVAAAADLRRIHVRATAAPAVQGVQEFHITPNGITVDSPSVAARLSTRVSRVHLDGLLGRCRLIEALASQAVQDRLTANDPVVSVQIEQATRERVEDEGYALAYRINGLLHHGVWDRLGALDYVPTAHLTNDADGIRSDTYYADGRQLAAPGRCPEIPPSDFASLDIVTWVHESAINNSCESWAGIRLDEATARDLWQVQRKLTSDDWESLPPGRYPAEIVLADESPIAVTFSHQAVDVHLRATSCALDGRTIDSGLRTLRIRYQIRADSTGLRFTRQAFSFSDPLPADIKTAWEQVLSRFFGETIRPMPKFRNSGFSQFLRMHSLRMDNGWLVVGLARLVPTAPSDTHATNEESQ